MLTGNDDSFSIAFRCRLEYELQQALQAKDVAEVNLSAISDDDEGES